MQCMCESILSPEVNGIAAKVIRAFLECDDDVQQIVRDMIAVVSDPETDAEDRDAAMATIAEALFPSHDNGRLGIRLEEAEKAMAENSPEGARAIRELDEEELTFAARLKTVMEQKGLTQVELAQKAGVGQPAISMILTRQCRPQQRTVKKLADALGVSPGELWSA